MGRLGFPPDEAGPKTVELDVVTEVVVVELLVEEVTVVDVEVNLELIVVVSVAVCAGDVSGVGLVREGEFDRRIIRKISITQRSLFDSQQC